MKVAMKCVKSCFEQLERQIYVDPKYNECFMFLETLR